MFKECSIKKINNVLERCKVAPGFKVGMYFLSAARVNEAWRDICELDYEPAKIRNDGFGGFTITYENGSCVRAMVLTDNCIGHRNNILLVDDDIREVDSKRILKSSIYPYVDEESGCTSLNPKPIYFEFKKER